MSYKVFISYSTKDLATANALKTWVDHAGASSFLAEYSVRPSEPLSQKIEVAIQDCDLFVLLWSQNAAQSEWVPQEIGIARGRGRSILPVLLHPGIAPPAFILALKYLPLYPDPNAAVQAFYAQLTEMMRKKDSSDALGTAIVFGLVLAGLVAVSSDSGGSAA